MTRLVLTVCLVMSLAGCALRPRYSAFVSSATPGPTVTLMVKDRATGQPVKGARVEVGDGKSRLVMTTAEDGTFTLPVSKGYLAEDPMLVVTTPVEVGDYELVPAPAAQVKTDA